MPIGPFESEVLRLLASNRNPDSYVGGATVLHQAPDSPRASADIDVFHDTAPAVHDAAARDTETLQAAGYEVRIVSRQESFCRGIVSKGPLVTKLEWVQDIAFRFFPVEPDVQLGWRLNFWDVGTNKVLAFCGREKLRDWLDVIYLHERHLCLAALVWAAAAKDPGLTPEFLLDAAKRFGRATALGSRRCGAATRPGQVQAAIPCHRGRSRSSGGEAFGRRDGLPLSRPHRQTRLPRSRRTGLPETHPPLRQHQRRLAAHPRKLSP
jgi:hypothetical protein